MCFDSPEYFDNEWKSKIKSEVSPDNWRLRVSNLKKIIDRITDYYNEILMQPLVPLFTLPDSNAIGKDSSSDDLGRLLQLILVCAVNCENKQEYIEVIMGLEEDVQHGVMQAIQELMNTGGRDRSESSISITFPDSLNVEQPAFLKDQLRRLQEELQLANDAKDQLTQKCFEMEKKMRILRDEKESIALENERLMQHVNDNQRINSKLVDEISDESLRDRHFSKLQSRIDALQEDLIKTETSKDEYRVRIEILEKELIENRLQNEDLQRKAKEARQLKDELDIHKHLSEKAEKLEQTVESYKKKIEEMSELKRQIRMLQEKNREMAKINMDLEEQSNKSASVKVQMDVYKKQIQELQEQVVEQRHRADKIEFEYKMLEGKYEQLVSESDRVKREKVQLKLELDETRRRGSSFNEDSIPAIAKELCLNAELTPVNDMQRLQQENSVLKNKLEENRE
ncbi:protein Hook 3-like protein, partial [Leptotrombidium deliense]